MRVDELDTPVLVVDQDRLERNLGRWQEFCDARGLRCRPHVKTHKCVEIARLQLELGAVGLVCQKLGEAEVMVDAGARDILVPYNIVGAAKLERLAALCERADVAVGADDECLLTGLERAAARSRRTLSVLVECDTGHGRAGVQDPEAAATLAGQIERTSGLSFGGLFTHPASAAALRFLEQAVAAVRRIGLEPRTVSIGGTPMMWHAADFQPLVTEYRAGTYAFLDRSSIARGVGCRDDVALTVLATVVSRSTPGRAIVDAGSKSLSSDAAPIPGFGEVLGTANSELTRVDEEHGYVSVADGDAFEVGQRVQIVPNHACAVVNLFDRLHVVRGGRVTAIWSIAARGRSD